MNNPPQEIRRPGDIPHGRSAKKTRINDAAADTDELSLSLSFRSFAPPQQNNVPSSPTPTPPPPPPLPVPQTTSLVPNTNNIPLPLQLPPSHALYQQVPFPTPLPPSVNVAGPARAPRVRKNPTQTPKQEGKTDTVPALFPWATTHRATVHSLDYLMSKKIETITGEVQCKRCEKQYEIGFNLMEKFMEVGSFVAKNKESMHDRAPTVWMNPVLPTCRFCEQENSAKPIVALKKREINWLFLLLGQMLGCCTLEQLKYFCKHTGKHRTGAKNRVLYLTYLGLCKQLDPSGPFDR